MAITYRWAEVEPVISEQYITAIRNNEQNDILQSRDMFLSRRFDDYYKKVEIDNLLNSYTTNLDWKETVDTFDDILTLYPTQAEIDSIYTKIDAVVDTYDDLLNLYPYDFDQIIWQTPVDTFEEIETEYPYPESNWGVEVLSTNEKYKYNEITNDWHKTISAPENNWLIELGNGTKYIFSSETNTWKLLDAPAQDGWTINVKDTNYTYRYDAPTNTWIAISANAIPLATTDVDGLLSKTDYSFIRSLGLESVFKKMGLIDENGNVIDVEGIVNASIIPDIYLKMSQLEEKMLPLGSVIPFLLNTNVPPAGFVFAEGQELSREEYPDLWEKISTEVDTEGNPLVINDEDRYDYPGKFTTGDGDSTFRVPNLKGYFLRALDESDREFGSRQSDAIREHSHDVLVTGVGSIDEAVVQDNRLVLSGTTSNSYTDSTILAQYKSNEIETRPMNIAIRYLVKVIPSEKVPTFVDQGSIPDIQVPIDADTLNGHASSLTAQAGYIPVANAQGKLDASWFNLENYEDLIWQDPVENFEDIITTYPNPENNWAVKIESTGDKYKYVEATGEWEKIDYSFNDIFVNDDEVSEKPDSHKIPKTKDAKNLDDWITTVSEEDVDKWIRYLSSPEEDEDDILDLSSFEDTYDSSKFYVTKKKFQKFLYGLKLFISSYNHHYTTDDVDPTENRGYISNAERNKYSNKYTRSETDQRIQNFLMSYIPVVNSSVTPAPNKIPIADDTGKLSPDWMSDLFLNKIGLDSNTGYAEIYNDNVTIKGGIVDYSEMGKVTIEGGGDYSLSNISPATAIVSGYDLVDNSGGNIELYAGAGGPDVSSIGGSVIIQSGSGSAYDGTIDLNNIKINKNNAIYTNELNLKLQQNDGINNTNSLEITNSGITYVHDNLVNDSDDYTFTLNNDGTVETNKPNIANSLTILNGRALVPFENLPKTSIVNDIGQVSQEQTINTNLGNVIVATIGQNSNFTISDTTISTEAKELTFVLTVVGPYNVNWPINITWTSGREPVLEYGETAIIKLFRIGNSEWIGWKVGDGASVNDSILIDTEEVPDTNFTGSLHIYVTDTEEENVEP